MNRLIEFYLFTDTIDVIDHN